MDPNQTLVMACATVIEEMLPHIPQGMKFQVFEFGLHVNPDKLRTTLQDAINTVSGMYQTIILGYGLCSQAVIGLRANGCTLVVPRVDDCIAIFLGSHTAYLHQSEQEPGTYYLTKGWIEAGDTPFSEYERIAKNFGKERAERMYQLLLANYKRLALINTGQYELENYRNYASQTARRFNLLYEEIEGSDSLVKRLLNGQWDEGVVVVSPGEEIRYEHFRDVSMK